MLLSKQIAVYLNLAGCKLKQYTASVLKSQGIDLTPEQFLLVDILWNQGSMSQQKMADTLMKDKNSITKLVDALEKKKYVRREQDPDDRRSNLLCLSESAESLKCQAKEVGISAVDRIIDGIDESELNVFLDVLARMERNMTLFTGGKK